MPRDIKELYQRYITEKASASFLSPLFYLFKNFLILDDAAKGLLTTAEKDHPASR